jgi:hypothetical protein
VEKADAVLVEQPESMARLKRVADLIQGFETPYGMELLSSVHWVCTHNSPKATTADAAVVGVHNWNDRKREMFRTDHVRVAYDRLRELSWIH